MVDDLTSYATAQMLLEVFPALGRLIAVSMRDAVEEDTTLMQITVLMRIKDRQISTSDLAKMRRVSLQSASVLVQGLVERGWLSRTPDPDDRRRSLLQVTPEGLKRAQTTQEQITNVLANILGELSTDEADAAAVFLPALHRVVRAHMMPDDIL